MSSPSKRKETDLMKLMMADYEVEMLDDSVTEFSVLFHGPKDSPYEGGVWRIRVDLPLQYPYRSPSIGFMNKVFHPNVDLSSGTVCLDVINQTWSPMYDLLNIFETFLPQLLQYPNPSDPLNGEAASLLLKEPEKYTETVKDYVSRFASADQARAALRHGNRANNDDDDGGGDNDGDEDMMKNDDDGDDDEEDGLTFDDL